MNKRQDMYELKEYLFYKVANAGYKFLEQRFKRRMVVLVRINFLFLTIALYLFAYILLLKL